MRIMDAGQLNGAKTEHWPDDATPPLFHFACPEPRWIFTSFQSIRHGAWSMERGAMETTGS
jgi:hypothetical protein